MGLQRFSNNAITTLAGNITSGSLSLSVLGGSGALFPVLTTGDWFIATLIKSGSPGTLEIVKVTATATDTFTIVRAQEGSTAQAWSAGDTFAMLVTAGTHANFVQPPQLQTQGGNYAIDTGAANTYVVTLTPALAAPVVGMPFRWKAAHTNTGVSTLNGQPLITYTQYGEGSLLAGNVQANGLYTSVWDGSSYQLLNPSIFVANGQFSAALTGISGSTNVTFNWSRVFDQVLLFNINTNVAASINALLEIPTLPAVITPVTTKIVSAGSSSFTDNSVAGGFAVDAQILNSGSINFLKNGGASWSGGGNKGISAPFCIAYTVG